MKKNNYLIIAAAASGIIAAAAPQAQGTVIWTAGAPGGTSGGALDFDPTGATAVNGGTFLGTGIAGSTVAGDYTVSMWINADSVAGESWFFGTGNQGLHLGIRNNPNISNGPPVVPGTPSTLSQGHWGNDSDGTTSLLADAWYHTTFTYDADGGSGAAGSNTAGLQSIYLDGVLQAATETGAPNRTNTDLIIGARTGGATNRGPFDGQVDDVALWDSVISGADITAVAGGTAADTLGALAYWDFEDDQTGTTAAVSGTLGATLTEIVAVPEPSSVTLVLLGALGLVRRKRA